MRCRIPIIYLVDSSGVNLPVPGRRLPRAVRREPAVLLQLDHAEIPTRAAARRGHGAVHRGRRLPARAVRPHRHGEGHVVHGPRRAEPREGRHRPDDRRRDARRRRDAHRDVSGVAHYAVDDDEACLAKLRDLVAVLPEQSMSGSGGRRGRRPPRGARRALRPAAGRPPHVVRHARAARRDRRRRASSTSSRDISRSEMICGDARIHGIPVGVIANQRGLIKGRPGTQPRFGGILYAESAEKVAFFIDRCDRERHAASLRARRLRLHGRRRSRARGNHSRRRALRRSDGDGARRRRSCSP